MVNTSIYRFSRKKMKKTVGVVPYNIETWTVNKGKTKGLADQKQKK